MAVTKQLSAPNAPRLSAVDGAFEARLEHRAFGADVLGLHDVPDVVAEEDRGGDAEAFTGGLLAPGLSFVDQCFCMVSLLSGSLVLGELDLKIGLKNEEDRRISPAASGGWICVQLISCSLPGAAGRSW